MGLNGEESTPGLLAWRNNWNLKGDCLISRDRILLDFQIFWLSMFVRTQNRHEGKGRR